jgi:hypothetical protein
MTSPIPHYILPSNLPLNDKPSPYDPSTRSLFELTTKPANPPPPSSIFEGTKPFPTSPGVEDVNPDHPYLLWGHIPWMHSTIGNLFIDIYSSYIPLPKGEKPSPDNLPRINITTYVVTPYFIVSGPFLQLVKCQLYPSFDGHTSWATLLNPPNELSPFNKILAFSTLQFAAQFLHTQSQAERLSNSSPSLNLQKIFSSPNPTKGDGLASFLEALLGDRPKCDDPNCPNCNPPTSKD